METVVTIVDYTQEYQSSIRRILEKIGWAEQYISPAEKNMQELSQNKEFYGVYLAILGIETVGFLYVQYYAWNQLCQIHGLAVDPEVQRQGIASALVSRAEWFAHSKKARGIYVDTPQQTRAGENSMKRLVFNLDTLCRVIMKMNLMG